MKGTGYDVICPGCKGRYHETGELFNSEQTSHGGMLRFKKKFGPQGYNWSGFPFNTSMRSGDLECPSCGSLYCGGGTKIKVESQTDCTLRDITPPDITVEPVTIIPEPTKEPTTAHVCPDCGRTAKSYAGLMAHMRHCKGKIDG